MAAWKGQNEEQIITLLKCFARLPEQKDEVYTFEKALSISLRDKKNCAVVYAWRIQGFLDVPYLISCVASSNYSNKRCRLFIKSDGLPGSTKKIQKDIQILSTVTKAYSRIYRTHSSDNMYYYHLTGQMEEHFSLPEVPVLPPHF